jgi:hypothetical protein
MAFPLSRNGGRTCYVYLLLTFSFLRQPRYVLVRVTLTLVAFVLLLVSPEAFGEGQFNNPKAAYVYFVAALNVSQVWAMYCLVFWYQ